MDSSWTIDPPRSSVRRTAASQPRGNSPRAKWPGAGLNRRHRDFSPGRPIHSVHASPQGEEPARHPPLSESHGLHRVAPRLGTLWGQGYGMGGRWRAGACDSRSRARGQRAVLTTVLGHCPQTVPDREGLGRALADGANVTVSATASRPSLSSAAARDTMQSWSCSWPPCTFAGGGGGGDPPVNPHAAASRLLKPLGFARTIRIRW